MFHRMLDLPAVERSQYDLSSHRIAIHAGARCPPHIKQQMIDWWGPIINEYYSGTESVGFTHVTSQDWLLRPGTVGQPYGCAVHIIGDDGERLGPNEIGAVYFEGKSGLEYHNDPAKTASAHHANGWATMGDIGYVDEDGFLFLTDRKAFTIISGGVNIYPSEIEAAFSGHPMVRDIAVFGIPDADMGEAVFALVELHPGHEGDTDDVAELTVFAKQSLASFKLPRRIAFGSAGRSETGKIKKAELRAAYADGKHGFATQNKATASRISPVHRVMQREGDMQKI